MKSVQHHRNSKHGSNGIDKLSIRPNQPRLSEAASPPSTIQVALIGSNNQTVGKAEFTAVQEGVQMDVQVTGLSPGVHGLHIHEKALCEAPSFDSAGAHFNPQKKQHGFMNPKGAHAGDLPISLSMPKEMGSSA